MTKEIPFIARMIIIEDVISDTKTQREDNSYYNTKYDSECEYCQNTTAWD